MKSLVVIIFMLYTFTNGAYALPKCVGSWSSATWNNCQGTYTFADGENYVGEWKDGKRNGQGTNTFADGENYVGEFKNGKYDGQGTNTFADGENYVGELKDGKRK